MRFEWTRGGKIEFHISFHEMEGGGGQREKERLERERDREREREGDRASGKRVVIGMYGRVVRWTG